MKSQNQKQPKRPSAQKWISGLWYANTMEYYTAQKKSGLLIHRTCSEYSSVQVMNEIKWQSTCKSWSLPGLSQWLVHSDQINYPPMFENKISSLSGLCLNTDNPPTLGWWWRLQLTAWVVSSRALLIWNIAFLGEKLTLNLDFLLFSLKNTRLASWLRKKQLFQISCNFALSQYWLNRFYPRYFSIHRMSR